jgi:Flp pilus assembly protein TadB
MTEEKVLKETLQEKLDTITQRITRKQWKYYHIESVQNFICHLYEFSSERTEERMSIKINSYLSLLQEKINEEHDVHSLAKELYPSIWSIADEYRHGLGFINKPSYFLHLIVWVALFFILKSSFGTSIGLSVVAAIVIVTVIRTQMKIKARRYF